MSFNVQIRSVGIRVSGGHCQSTKPFGNVLVYSHYLQLMRCRIISQRNGVTVHGCVDLGGFSAILHSLRHASYWLLVRAKRWVLRCESKNHDRNIIHESADECHETTGEVLVILASPYVIPVIWCAPPITPIGCGSGQTIT